MVFKFKIDIEINCTCVVRITNKCRGLVGFSSGHPDIRLGFHQADPITRDLNFSRIILYPIIGSASIISPSSRVLRQAMLGKFTITVDIRHQINICSGYREDVRWRGLAFMRLPILRHVRPDFQNHPHDGLIVLAAKRKPSGTLWRGPFFQT